MKTREIKDRITSVKNISTITKAMKTVAAVRLRKAQERMLAARPYAEGLEKLLSHLLRGEERPSHELFETQADAKGVLVIAVSSDRGLCGGFNTNVSKLGLSLANGKYNEQYKAGKLTFLFVGKKGYGYLKNRVKDAIMINDHIDLVGKDFSFIHLIPSLFFTRYSIS